MAKATARGGVHAILGPDSFLAEEALEPLLQEALGKDREGALQVLHGDETTWGRLVETARTGSLFVSRRRSCPTRSISSSRASRSRRRPRRRRWSAT